MGQKTKFLGEQADGEFLLENEFAPRHDAVGDSSPHHPRGHSFSSSTDHTDFQGTPTDKQLPQYNETTGKWEPKDAGAASVTGGQDIAFGDDQTPYSRTKDSAWDALKVISFRGTNHVGTPKGFEIIVEHENADLVSEARIYDVTNGNVIGTITGMNGLARVTYFTETLSNLPTGNAQFEIQFRLSTTSGNAMMHVFYFVLYWE